MLDTDKTGQSEAKNSRAERAAAIDQTVLDDSFEKPRYLRVRDSCFELGKRTIIMGVINVSPDSFSGDGISDCGLALARFRSMIEAGVDIVDLGAESTRPGHTPLSEAAELERLLPVLEEFRRVSSVPISIDTTKSSVLRQALVGGADMLNCVSAPRDELLDLARAHGIPVVVTDDKRRTPEPGDLVAAVIESLAEIANYALSKGIEADRIVVDPGIGFGKYGRQNVCILSQLERFKSLKLPLLIGTSRKSFLKELIAREHQVNERDFATAATVALSIEKGADLVRVHNVEAIRDVVQVTDAIVRRGRGAMGDG